MIMVIPTVMKTMMIHNNSNDDDTDIDHRCCHHYYFYHYWYLLVPIGDHSYNFIIHGDFFSFTLSLYLLRFVASLCRHIRLFYGALLLGYNIRESVSVVGTTYHGKFQEKW